MKHMKKELLSYLFTPIILLFFFAFIGFIFFSIFLIWTGIKFTAFGRIAPHNAVIGADFHIGRTGSALSSLLFIGIGISIHKILICNDRIGWGWHSFIQFCILHM